MYVCKYEKHIKFTKTRECHSRRQESVIQSAHAHEILMKYICIQESHEVHTHTRISLKCREISRENFFNCIHPLIGRHVSLHNLKKKSSKIVKNRHQPQKKLLGFRVFGIRKLLVDSVAVFVCVCVCLCVCVREREREREKERERDSVCVCVCLCTYACVCVCVCNNILKVSNGEYSSDLSTIIRTNHSRIQYTWLEWLVCAITRMKCTPREWSALHENETHSTRMTSIRNFEKEMHFIWMTRINEMHFIWMTPINFL